MRLSNEQLPRLAQTPGNAATLARLGIDLSNNHSGKIANAKSAVCNKPVGQATVAKAPAQYYIHFHSVRRRLADYDNLSGKAVQDALVAEGLLQDDNHKIVLSTTHSQEKTKDEEVTIVEVWRADIRQDQGLHPQPVEP